MPAMITSIFLGLQDTASFLWQLHKDKRRKGPSGKDIWLPVAFRRHNKEEFQYACLKYNLYD